MSFSFFFTNRYILITSPSWYDKIYRKCNIIAMIVGMWLFSFLMMTPPLLGIWGDLGLKEATFSCTILSKEGKSPKKFFFAFGFIIPCLTIIISYSCIFIKVRQSRRNVLAHRFEINSSSFLCWSPTRRQQNQILTSNRAIQISFNRLKMQVVRWIKMLILISWVKICAEF